MIQLAEEVFDTRNDSQQLDVNEEVMKQLHALHPATLSEYDDGNGPVVWILLIPTTNEIMQQFLEHKINEQQVLAETPVDCTFDSIYLCSALVLPEYRGQGIAKKLTIEAIEHICKTHSIKNLFVWPFSEGGDKLAKSIANTVGLPLFEKLI
jgi:GNAT superfamily N-acetyltransferase